MQVVQCDEAQLDVIAELFNDYRIFYELPSDVPACRAFIQQNLQQKRSVIFLLLDNEGRAVGFSQLYPAISSLDMSPYHYLSDLYVAQSERQNGYARHLMNYITDHFTLEGSRRLTLETATTNRIAQNLYESLGYEREERYITYHQRLQ